MPLLDFVGAKSTRSPSFPDVGYRGTAQAVRVLVRMVRKFQLSVGRMG